jgi:coproporphyrinogen III oxidase-like Fe-S oxidoreductase
MVARLLMSGPDPETSLDVAKALGELAELLSAARMRFHRPAESERRLFLVGEDSDEPFVEMTLVATGPSPHRFSLPLEPVFRIPAGRSEISWGAVDSNYFGPRIITATYRVVQALLSADGGSLCVSAAPPSSADGVKRIPGQTNLPSAPAPDVLPDPRTSRSDVEEKISLLKRIGHFSTALFSLILTGHDGPLSWDDCLHGWQSFRDGVSKGTFSPELGLYLHIPVCSHQCTYCQIPVSIPTASGELDRFVEAVQFELRQYRNVLGGYPVGAMSVGGGTPNLLSAAQTRRLLSSVFDVFPVQSAFHVTLDLSPAATTMEKLKAWREYGASRVVFGVQTLDEAILRRINRRSETRKAITRAINMAHEVGFECIGVDLIAGLPGDTVEGFRNTLKGIVEIHPHHIQIFRWILEPKCPEYQMHGPMTPHQLEEREKIIDAAREFMNTGSQAREYAGLSANFGLEYRRSDVSLFHMTAHYEMLRSAQKSILALGHFGVSRIQGVMEYSANQPWLEYLQWPQTSTTHPFRGFPMTRRYAMAANWAANLDEGFLSRKQFQGNFGVTPEDVFGNDIDYLCRQGWLVRQGDLYVVPKSAGREESAMACTLVFQLEELRWALARQQEFDAAVRS